MNNYNKKLIIQNYKKLIKKYKKRKKWKKKKMKYFNYNKFEMNEINKIIFHYKLTLLLYLINNQSGFQVYLVSVVYNQSETNKKNKK